MTNELTPEYLLLKLTLYKSIELNGHNINHELHTFLFSDKNLQFDCFCVECKKDSTFKFSNRTTSSLHPDPLNHIFAYNDIQRLSFSCQRNTNHKYAFFFRINNMHLTKVGQYPSIADIELHKIYKYRSLLKGDYREFSKALRLYSSEIGAGSYVYLRRIFEKLIIQQKQIAMESDSSFSEDEFNSKRMDEKIKYIEHFLPDILVENRQLYAILSKGIHELSEQECLDMFPKVQLGIELILDWKLTEIENRKKEGLFSKFISNTVEKLKP